MKKIYLTLMWMITVIVIVAAVAYRFGFVSVGSWSDIESISDFSGETISDVTLDLDYGDVRVVSGDNFEMRYSGPERLNPECEVKDGVLYISSYDKHFSLGNFSCDIEIIIPENISLGVFDADVDAVDLTICDVALENLTIDTDAGEIALENVSGSSLQITADLSSTKVEECNFETINMESDLGDIEISGGWFQDGSIISEVANIDVDGLFDSLVAQSELGNITVNTYKDESQVNLDLDAEVGSVKVNGKKWQ